MKPTSKVSNGNSNMHTALKQTFETRGNGIPSLLVPLKHRNSFIVLTVNLKSPRKDEGSQWVCNWAQNLWSWQSQPQRVLAN